MKGSRKGGRGRGGGGEGRQKARGDGKRASVVTSQDSIAAPAPAAVGTTGTVAERTQRTTDNPASSPRVEYPDRPACLCGPRPCVRPRAHLAKIHFPSTSRALPPPVLLLAPASATPHLLPSSPTPLSFCAVLQRRRSSTPPLLLPPLILRPLFSATLPLSSFTLLLTLTVCDDALPPSCTLLLPHSPSFAPSFANTPSAPLFCHSSSPAPLSCHPFSFSSTTPLSFRAVLLRRRSSSTPIPPPFFYLFSDPFFC